MGNRELENPSSGEHPYGQPIHWLICAMLCVTAYAIFSYAQRHNVDTPISEVHRDDGPAGPLIQSLCYDSKGDQLIVGGIGVKNRGAHASAQVGADTSQTLGVVQLRDGKNGRLKRELSGTEGPVWSVALSPDGTLAAAGTASTEDAGGQIVIWDLKSNTLRHRLTHECNYVAALAFSPDGKTLASAAAGQVKLWNVSRGELIHAMAPAPDVVDALAFSLDGRLLASAGHDGVIRLSDAHTGAPRTTLIGHRNAVTGVAFSPDGQTLVSVGADGRGSAGELIWWDLESHRLSRRIDLPHCLDSIAISCDGSQIATSGGDWRGELFLWDMASGRQRAHTSQHNRIAALAFSRQGNLALAVQEEGIKISTPDSTAYQQSADTAP